MNNLFEDIDLESQLDVDTDNFITTEKTVISKEEENKNTEDLIEINDEPVSQEKDEIDLIVEDALKSNKNQVKPEEEITPETPSPDNKQHDSSPIKLFAKVLLEEGVISELDETEFDGSEDKIEVLIKSIKNEVVKAISDVEENYPSKIKQILEAYKNGVPEDEIFDYIQGEIEYSSITEEQLTDNEDLQKALIRQDLTNKGYTKEEIEEEITDAETVDKLLIKSLRAAKTLAAQQSKQLESKIEQNKTQLIAQQEAAKKQQEKVREYLDTTKEILPGIEMNKNLKDKIYNSMYKPAGKDSNGNPVSTLTLARSKDPVKFDTIFHYLLVNGVFEGKMDELIKPVKTKAVKDFEKVVNSNTTFKEGNQRVIKTPENNSTISALRSMFNT